MIIDLVWDATRKIMFAQTQLQIEVSWNTMQVHARAVHTGGLLTG